MVYPSLHSPSIAAFCQLVVPTTKIKPTVVLTRTRSYSVFVNELSNELRNVTHPVP